MLSAAVPLKIDVDLRFTVMAATFCRLLADRIRHCDQHQAPRTLFRKFVYTTAELAIDQLAITVQFGRCSNNAFLVKQGFAGEECRISWLG